MIKKVKFDAMKKTDGSWKFGVDFCRFGPKSELYGFIEKQAPQKALCLGPDPPPWEKYKIYRKLPIFTVLGAFNRAGKSVTKIGIYSKPPPKSDIYSDFNNLRPNFNARLNLSLPRHGIVADLWLCVSFWTEKSTQTKWVFLLVRLVHLNAV
jgi:hypothetical protein